MVMFPTSSKSTKLIAELKRRWFFFAVVIGVVFQFAQFIRSESIVLGALSEREQAIAAEGAPPQQQKVISVSLNVDVTKALGIQKALESRGLTRPEKTTAQAGPPMGFFEEPPAEGGPPMGGAAANNAASEEGLWLPNGKFNYRLPAVPTEFTLPPPNRTNQSTIVLCLSARENFERRHAIRETWAKGNDNVYFIIGGPMPGDNEDKDKTDPLSTSSMLFREQQLFGDIIDTIHPDTYSGLPYKLHFAMRWVMRNLDNVHWIAKSDDDCVVRVKLLEFFVLRKMNPFLPQVIGRVVVGSTPHRSGKWAEDTKYAAQEYPPWAFGSTGYIVSRPVAQYVADNDHYYWQGEDAGLGIWLIDSGLQVTWVDTPEVAKDEGCNANLYMIGHDLDVQAIRRCFGSLGDNVPERSHIIAFSAGRKDQFPGRINNPN